MRIPSIADLTAALHAKRYVVHTEPGRLNTVVLRNTPGTLDAFDDMLCAWVQGGPLFAARVTADPGKPSREHPKRKDGTAVWAVGQVLDAMVVGQHHPGTAGAYACLVPRIPIPVLRYTSVDDPTGEPSTSTSTQIHRAHADHESTVVGPWSEGCIVFANPHDFATYTTLAQTAVASSWGRFTVTCLEWR